MQRGKSLAKLALFDSKRAGTLGERKIALA
jgi:hypothetical protein